MGEKWMEEVAKAGGFEEHGKLKEQEKLLERMEKIPAEKFNAMLGMVDKIERIFDTGGSDLDLLGGIKDSITDTLKTELSGATAELVNGINTAINTILEPLMPFIMEAVNGINTMLSRGMGAIEALITGKFDEYIKNLKLELQPEVDKWQVMMTERMAQWQKPAYEWIYGWDIDALEASALEGGVYSGQFDLPPDAYEDILNNLKLPDFT